jgi:hypothetical protein
MQFGLVCRAPTKCREMAGAQGGARSFTGAARVSRCHAPEPFRGSRGRVALPAGVSRGGRAVDCRYFAPGAHATGARGGESIVETGSSERAISLGEQRLVERPPDRAALGQGGPARGRRASRSGSLPHRSRSLSCPATRSDQSFHLVDRSLRGGLCSSASSRRGAPSGANNSLAR